MKLDVQALTLQTFSRFGTYVDLLHPEDHDKIGADPGGFYRDMVQITLNGANASCSVSQVYPRPFVLDAMEYHNSTGEGMLPLDEDAIICFAPASTPDGPDPAQIHAIRVPHGTLVTIRPGVWHSPAYPCGELPLNMLVILPERVYATDCQVVPVPAADEIRIAVSD